MTTELLVGGGLVLAILFLLWRVELQKRKRAEEKANLLEARCAVLRDILDLERVLHGAQAEEANRIREEITKRQADLLALEPGEKIPDIFGGQGP